MGVKFDLNSEKQKKIPEEFKDLAKDFAENDRDATPDMGCYEFVLYSWNGTTNTDWSTASNWSTGSVPTASDDIIIGDKSNDPVIGSGVDVCGALTIQSGGKLTVNNGSNKLTAASLTLNSGAEIDISNGELECTGKFDHDGTLTMTGGTLDINGEYESSASSVEAISGGTITVAGEWDASSDDAFTPTGGTVEFNGGADQAFAQHSSSNFYNLTINNF